VELIGTSGAMPATALSSRADAEGSFDAVLLVTVFGESPTEMPRSETSTAFSSPADA
jgi:hypothetical protein